MKICDDLYWYPLRKPIQLFFGRGASCNVFALNQGDEIWLIDVGCSPFGRLKRIFNAMEKDNLDPAKISKVFITHAHPDHITALPELIQTKSIEIFVHEQDVPLLTGGDEYFWKQECNALGDYFTEFFGLPSKIVKLFSTYSMGPMPIIQKFTKITHGFKLSGSKYSLTALHSPGHTSGHCNFYIPELKALFCGDIIDPYFDHKPPINFGTSDFLAFQSSIRKMVDLDVEIFCPAHAAKIHFGKDHYREICEGTLKNLDFARNRTIELLQNAGSLGMRLKDFKGKYPKTIWQVYEQAAVPYSVMKVLEGEGHIIQKNGRFIYRESKI